MRDVDANGKVDRVLATFSESLQPSTDTAPWTLTNVPSGGTLVLGLDLGCDRNARHRRGRRRPEHGGRHLPRRTRRERDGHSRCRRQPGLLRLDRSRRPGDAGASSPSPCRTRTPTARSTASSPPSRRRSRRTAPGLLPGRSRAYPRAAPSPRSRSSGTTATLDDRRGRGRSRHRRRLLHGRARHRSDRHPRRCRQPLLVRSEHARRRGAAGARRGHAAHARRRRKRQGRPRPRHLLGVAAALHRHRPLDAHQCALGRHARPRSRPRVRPQRSSSPRAPAP